MTKDIIQIVEQKGTFVKVSFYDRKTNVDSPGYTVKDAGVWISWDGARAIVSVEPVILGVVADSYLHAIEIATAIASL